MRKPHWHGRRGAGRPGHGGGYRGAPGLARADRVLDKADLQVLLLSLLKEGTQHGYELIRRIKALSQGCYAPSPGMVYPTLNALAEEGLVSPASADAGRKCFALTEAGKARALANKQAMSAIGARLRALSESQEQVRAPIARALANLDLVLANVPPDASEEQIDQIVTLIDGAARQIERIC